MLARMRARPPHARTRPPPPPRSCFWLGDRRALTQKYGIDDSELNQPCACPSAVCLMTCCPQCLLVQELHHINQVGLSLHPGPPGFAKAVPPTVVQQSMV